MSAQIIDIEDGQELLSSFEERREAAVAHATDLFEEHKETMQQMHAELREARLLALVEQYEIAREEALEALATVTEDAEASLQAALDESLQARQAIADQCDLSPHAETGQAELGEAASRSQEELSELLQRLEEGHVETIDNASGPLLSASEDLVLQVNGLADEGHAQCNSLGTAARDAMETRGEAITGEVQTAGDTAMRTLEQAMNEATFSCTEVASAGSASLQERGEQMAVEILGRAGSHHEQLSGAVSEANERLSSEEEARRALLLDEETAAQGRLEEQLSAADNRHSETASRMSGLQGSSEEGFSAESASAEDARAQVLDLSAAKHSEITGTCNESVGAVQSQSETIHVGLESLWGEYQQQLESTASTALSALRDLDGRETAALETTVAENGTIYTQESEAASGALEQSRSAEAAAVDVQYQDESTRLEGTGSTEEVRMTEQHGKNQQDMTDHSDAISTAVETLFQEQIGQIRETYATASQAFDDGPRTSMSDTIEARADELLADVCEKGYVDGDTIKEALVDVGLTVLMTELAPMTFSLSFVVDLVAHDFLEDLILQAIDGVDIPIRIEFEAEPVSPFQAIANAAETIAS